MGRYLIRRTLQIIPVFVGTTFIIFALVFAIPGDPIRALAGERPLAESTYQELRDRYNLDDPLLVQYGKYMGGLVQGDFGSDFRGREVTDIMAERFPVTVRLTLFAFAFELVLGLLAGVLAGLRRGSFVDNLVLVTTVAVVSIPVFVLGFTAQILFGVKLGWLPIAGLYQGWTSYLLPGMVLGALSLAYVARLTRTSLVENLRADYVRTATAKGMPRSRVVGRHALRNSLIPVVTFLGVDLGALMGGAIVTEGIFNIPGVGQQVFLSIQQQESTVVVGIVTALVLVFILANLLVDVLYAVLDPRIRYD
ncbi:MAG TPA: ABC transporter permease [Actinomycetota bacterium]|jgi:peptide/nickel transport system permease protein/oligopeptide transport system permease protein|nr:ABC transporter permease [Actinomycetota bacterium]